MVIILYMDATAMNWSLYDKLATLIALVLMSGYYLAPIEYVVTTTINIVLGPLAALLQFSVLLFCLSGTTGVLSTVVRHRIQNTERLQQLRERIEELQTRLTETHTQDDDVPSDLQTDQKEMIQNFLSMMKLQFRPAVWSLIVTVPIFLWVRWVMTAPTAAIAPIAFSLPLIGQLAWTTTVIGPIKVWLVWYFGGSMSSAILSRKILTVLAE
jgi:uncharacterized membrane protein (DUF106 family)